MPHYLPTEYLPEWKDLLYFPTHLTVPLLRLYDGQPAFDFPPKSVTLR
jgi:hypothetical protein